MFRWLLFCYLLLFCLATDAQTSWTLKSNKDSIKTFTAPQPGSSINAIRVECTMNAGLIPLLATIINVAEYPKWVFGTKLAYLVKEATPNELYYYSEINFPWPAANRDFVSHLVIKQNRQTKVVTIAAENVSGYVKEKKGVVRIEESVAKWVLTPLNSNQVLVNYELSVNPGGTLPAWIINPFSSKGPVETFKQLRKQILKNENTEKAEQIIEKSY